MAESPTAQMSEGEDAEAACSPSLKVGLGLATAVKIELAPDCPSAGAHCIKVARARSSKELGFTVPPEELPSLSLRRMRVVTPMSADCKFSMNIGGAAVA